MKKKIPILNFFLCVVVIVCTNAHLLCQPMDISKIAPKFVFGKTSLKELNMTVCEFDSNANGAILYKKNNFYFDYNAGEMCIEVVVRYKIFKQAAVQNVDKFIYLPNEFNLRDFEGYVYNLDEQNQIVTTKISQSKNTTKTRVSKKVFKMAITPPNLRVGSIYDLKYVIKSPYVDMPDIVFSENQPVYWTEAHYAIPSEVGDYIASLKNHSDKEIAFQHQGTSEQNINGKLLKDLLVEVGFRNLKALPDEPIVYDKDRYACKLSVDIKNTFKRLNGNKLTVQHNATWSDAAKFLLEEKSFADLYESYASLSSIANDAKALFPDTLAAIKSVISRIRTEFVSEKNGFWLTDELDMSKVAKSKKINQYTAHYVLFNILYEMGIREHALMLLRTRDEGFLSENTSSLVNCNRVIVCLDIRKKSYFFDIGNTYLKDGILTPNYSNGTAFLLYGKKEGKFINFKNNASYQEIYTLTLKPNIEKEQVELTGKLTGGGYYAGTLREELAEEGEVKYKETFKRKNQDFEFSNISFSGIGDKESAVDVALEGVLKEGVSFVGDRVFIKPAIGLFLKTPFSEEKRTLPIDFMYQRLYLSNLTIEIPKGYDIESLPKSEKMLFANNEIQFAYVCEQKEEKVLVNIRLNINQEYFLPNEYVDVRSFFDKMIKKMNEEIILKKH